MTPNNNVLKISDIWHEPVQFKITVIKEGGCRAHHKTGDTFECTWTTPEGLCPESFIGMYPLFQSLRVMGDMRELGSPQRNCRVYNCPSRVIQFQIDATYLCNLCGTTLPIQANEIPGHLLENSAKTIHLRVCSKCFEEHKNRALSW
ncbi:MAG: hypothetical protein ACFFDU_07310 [Candidatus Thorarchaeota archaeon]